MFDKHEVYAVTAKTIIKNLEKRNMEGYYCEDSKEAVKKALKLMNNGSIIAWGGSSSLNECGLMDAIHNGNYELVDRTAAKTQEEKRAVFGRTATSDYFLMSTNAITLEGELINIDGIGNRVASLICGPQNVIIIAGMNKVVSDIESGYKRIKCKACPPNAVRLDRKVPCATTGKCAECLNNDCFCNQIVITRRSGTKGRIKVILVGEELGF